MSSIFLNCSDFEPRIIRKLLSNYGKEATSPKDLRRIFQYFEDVLHSFFIRTI